MSSVSNYLPQGREEVERAASRLRVVGGALGGLGLFVASESDPSPGVLVAGVGVVMLLAGVVLLVVLASG